ASPTPAEPAKRAPSSKAGFVTLTLLDGTRVRLPAAGAKGEEGGARPRGLTAHDLISALKAKAEGKDVSQVLPDSSTELLFASLLSLLIRKGLVADWEFVAEFQKNANKAREEG